MIAQNKVAPLGKKMHRIKRSSYSALLNLAINIMRMLMAPGDGPTQSNVGLFKGGHDASLKINVLGVFLKLNHACSCYLMILRHGPCMNIISWHLS